ncbi:MAG: Hpt domain-containing protein [Oscillospiraceae bacterium]
MNCQTLEKAGINYNEGVQRFSNNNALYEKFLNKFLADETMSDCRKAIESKDFDAILKTVHTLKGVSGNLSMNILYKRCALIVDAIRSGDEAAKNEIFEMFCDVEQSYALIIEALKAE